jgi:hypothetical protein
MAYGLWGLFHYLFLLPLALWTHANLNSLLCPAISDPFSGPNYKLHAIWHQVLYNDIMSNAGMSTAEMSNAAECLMGYFVRTLI